MFFKFSFVCQEEKEQTRAFREMEEKLMTTAFYRLVSYCFALYFNDCSNRTLAVVQ
jgi:hypothetical protein